MTKNEAKATPEWLAQQVVKVDKGGTTLLVDAKGALVAVTEQGAEMVRAWLVEQIEAAFKAGVNACVVTLSEAAREKEEAVKQARAEAVNIATTALHNELRAALGVAHGWEECIATVRDLVAKGKAANGHTAKAHSDAVTMCADQLRDALGTTLGWRECVDMVRDIVAKDKAKPAPTDATAEDAAIDGLVGDAVRPWTQPDRSATLHHRDGTMAIFLGDTPLALARTWLRPWLLAAWARGVAHGQQPDAPPVLADSFGVAAREQVAAERAVDAATVAPSEEAIAAAREEGRRAGWKEAVDMMGAIFDQKIDDTKLLERDEERLRKKLAEVAERKADHIAHAAAIQQAIARVRLVAPKEAP